MAINNVGGSDSWSKLAAVMDSARQRNLKLDAVTASTAPTAVSKLEAARSLPTSSPLAMRTYMPQGKQGEGDSSKPVLGTKFDAYA